MPLLALWVCRLSSIKLHIGGSVTFFRGLVTHIVHDEYALNQIIGKSNTCLWSSFGSQGFAKSDALIQSILCMYVCIQGKV